MISPAIALFGEAEKGSFDKGFLFHEIGELLDYLGNPPPDSRGLYYAIQAISYRYKLIYFRVEQEGFSIKDYLNGIKILSESPLIDSIKAICTPGLGDKAIIDELLPICYQYHQILITNEKDLYDYLTSN